MEKFINLLKKDYEDIFLSHLYLYYKELCVFFDKYPHIENIDISSKTVYIEKSNISESTSVVLHNPVPYGPQAEKRVNYYFLTTDKDNNLYKLKDIFVEINGFINVINKIHENPYYQKELKGKNILFESSGILNSFKKCYGEGVSSKIQALKDKESLDSVVPLGSVSEYKRVVKI